MLSYPGDQYWPAVTGVVMPTEVLVASILANDIRLYYEETGSGAPIVCIHGTPQLGAGVGRRAGPSGEAWPGDRL